jgi:hypothetical protein
LFWKEGTLQVQSYALVDPSEARYEALEGEGTGLQFFAKGHPYRLLGLIPCERHLFQLDDPNARIYLLGSDSTGRDVFSRLIYGARVSLFVGLLGISITTVLGLLIGGLSGYFGGRIDFLTMRLVEFMMAMPGLYLLLALRSALAPHFASDEMFYVIVIILSLIGWAGTARVLRGMPVDNSALTHSTESTELFAGGGYPVDSRLCTGRSGAFFFRTGHPRAGGFMGLNVVASTGRKSILFKFLVVINPRHSNLSDGGGLQCIG